MIWWLVISLGWSCPGGIFGGLIPETAKPFLCEPTVDYEIFSRKKHAFKRVKKTGCGTRLFWCKNLKCRERDVTCKTVIEIEGGKP